MYEHYFMHDDQLCMTQRGVRSTETADYSCGNKNTKWMASAPQLLMPNGNLQSFLGSLPDDASSRFLITVAQRCITIDDYT